MSMKRIFVLLFALCLAVTASARTDSRAVADTATMSLRSGGLTRTYTMHIPENLSPGAPLVVYLHGYGSRRGHKKDLDAAADRHGFAVCYPDGTCDSLGKRCWNVGYPVQAGMKVDDVKFLEHLVRHVCARFDLDRRNAFCTGMSNGGEMCYLLAYTQPRLFAAVASVAGLTMEWIYRRYDAPMPVPIFEMHGTEDRTSEWTGDLENRGGWGSYLPVPVAVGYWVARNKCTSEQTERIESRTPGRHIVAHRYTGGCDVWLYEVVGGTHSWGEKDLDTGEEVWRFFSRHMRSK